MIKLYRFILNRTMHSLRVFPWNKWKPYKSDIANYFYTKEQKLLRSLSWYLTKRIVSKENAKS